MSEFVYLYRGGEAGRSPERMQQTMQKWMAWFKDLAEKVTSRIEANRWNAPASSSKASRRRDRRAISWIHADRSA
jgi:hypothetical protein